MITEYSKRLAEEFYAWEQRCRGTLCVEYPIHLEPEYTPFVYTSVRRQYVDDGRQPSMFEYVSGLFKKNTAPQIQASPELPVIQFKNRSSVHVLQITLARTFKLHFHEFEEFLIALSYSASLLSFEIIATNNTIIFQLACRRDDLQYVRTQLQVYLPECAVEETTDRIAEIMDDRSGIEAIDFGLKEEFIRSCQIPKNAELDSLMGIIALLEGLDRNDHVIIQILFNKAIHPWNKAIANAVFTHSGELIFKNAPEMASLAKEKMSLPLFAVSIRIAVKSKHKTNDFILHKLITAFVAISKSPVNSLKQNNGTEYTNTERLDDIVLRESHRLGMLLTSKELVNFAHLPNGALNSSRINKKISRTKGVPEAAKGHPFTLGINVHQGKETEVSLSEIQRSVHTSICGGTGMGKSNLLMQMVINDITAANGFTLVDVHGDLADAVLGYIPEHRAKDVIVIDLSDEEFPIAFNILNAHSEIEKNVLSSDLVAAFRRNSASWGDQMNSLFANAILAFLENTEVGTLADIRRFLIEKKFREQILATVTDPAIIYYWQHEYPFIKGNAIAPVLTRLDVFLRPKVIRNMVSQKESLDFESIMDTKKILLVKLPIGLIGAENSYLLGSFIITKLQQAAMARQTKNAEDRTPYYLYIDEFSNMITASISQIVSGARKYKLSLIIAYQSFQVLQKIDTNIANEIIANVGTKIYFKLGETDANKLADGLSFFSGDDLQNLSVGEVIAKINTNENDFSFRTIPAQKSKVPSEIKQKIIANSRTKYCKHKSEVERLIHEGLQQDVKKGKEPTVNGSVHNPPIPPAVITTPVFSVPVEGVDKSVDQIFETLTQKKEDSQHKYLQTLIKKRAEARGYKATTEWMIPGENGRIDVVLELDQEKIAVEVSVTTQSEWELHNIKKCLDANFKMIVSCSSDKRSLNKLKEYAHQHLTTEEFLVLNFYTPDELFLWLDTAQAKNAATNTRMKGYTVKVEYDAVSDTAMKQKRNSVGRIILESRQKKAKKEQ